MAQNKKKAVAAKKTKPTAKKASPAKKFAASKPAKTADRTTTVANANAAATNRPSAFKPIDDRVLIAVEEESDTTAGGIIIPGNVESRPNRGVILAKGPGRKNKKGKLRPLDVSVGDRVLFPEYAGTKIQIGSEDFLILREEELLGIVTL